MNASPMDLSYDRGWTNQNIMGRRSLTPQELLNNGLTSYKLNGSTNFTDDGKVGLYFISDKLADCSIIWFKQLRAYIHKSFLFISYSCKTNLVIGRKCFRHLEPDLGSGQERRVYKLSLIAEKTNI